MEHCRNPQRQTTADCARGGPLTRVAKDAQRLKTGRRNSSSKLTPKCSTHPLMKAQDRSPCQVRALPQSFIVRSMNSRNRNRVWAWLLCALLFWLTANPPHCDLCDGVSFTVASAHQSILKHSHPVAPDSCNGICTCCGFYGLPNVGQALIPANVELAGVAPEATRLALAPHSTIFRPPRIVVS